MSILDFLMDPETAVSAQKTLTDDVKSKGFSSNNVWYRYRNMADYASCTIRFLPKAEEQIAGKFWLPKKVIRLKFADPVNIGQDVNVAVPVLQMYVGGKPSDDPILGKVGLLYEQAKALEAKGESEKSKQVRSIASAHYIKGECIAQGFVIQSPFQETELPENPIRLFELNKQIINVIEAKLETENPEMKMEFWVCHGIKGSNFIIKKTKTGDGKFPKYDDGTGFSMRTTPLSQEQLAAVEKYDLWDLRSFLPQRPSDDEYKVLAYMVDQSIAGNRVYDPDWDAELKAVRPFRTAQGERGDDMGNMHEQVRETLNKISGVTSATDVMSQLSRTNGRSNDTDDTSVEEPAEPVAVEEPAGDADEYGETAAPVSRSSSEVRSLMEKINKQRGKPATASE